MLKKSIYNIMMLPSKKPVLSEQHVAKETNCLKVNIKLQTYIRFKENKN